MNKKITKSEIEALMKSTEIYRERLRRSWQKVEELDAAIRTAKHQTDRARQPRKVD